MLIRILLMVVFFLWALLLPLPHRLTLREELTDKSHVNQLAMEDFLCSRAINLTDRLKADDPQRLEALFNLAKLRWQQLRFADAAQIYTQIAEVRTALAKRKYDEQYVQAMLNLAGVLSAQNKLDDAQSHYESILHYDQTFLSPHDKKVARDLNNLGVNCYLLASNQSDKIKQAIFLTKANSLLEEAAKIYASTPSYAPSLANTLETQYLVLRDLGALEKAKQVKAQALSIQQKFKHLCLAP